MNLWLNKVTKYQDKEILFGYLITLKTRELAHYLLNVKTSFNISTSKLTIKRKDSDEIRQKILAISYTDWGKMGFSKGALYYMKTNAKRNKPFTLHKNVQERLNQWDLTVQKGKANLTQLFITV